MSTVGEGGSDVTVRVTAAGTRGDDGWRTLLLSPHPHTSQPTIALQYARKGD